MTDINKQIEDLKYILSWSSNINYNERVVISDTVHHLESQRWRKVSEELPEQGDIIIAKGDTSDFQDMYLIEIDSDYSMSVLTSYYKEWKPID